MFLHTMETYNPQCFVLALHIFDFVDPFASNNNLVLEARHKLSNFVKILEEKFRFA